MAHAIIAERYFTAADQEQFASISGDHNPLHMNSSVARRTIAGHRVVHGIHAVLWSLDRLYRQNPELPRLTGIAARFEKMIHLADRVRVVSIDPRRIDVMVDDGVAVRVSLAFDAPGMNDTSPSNGPVFAPVQPRDLTFEEAAASHGQIDLSPAEPAVYLFPALAAALGSQSVMFLVRTSFLVGMVSPGLHSLYSGFNLTAANTNSDMLGFRAAESDSRFRLVKFAVTGGGWVGSVETHARSNPVSQASISDIALQIIPGEFRSASALVIGGSRGLGEVIAKILGAGGAHVTLTYAMGENDARDIQSDIVAHGGHCDILQYDARSDAREQLSSLNVIPNQLYYLATPQIFRRKAAGFVRERFEDFLTFYVDGFYDVCRELQSKSGTKIAAFYPSSVSVETRPPNMTEYSMAKAAGEILCADMQALEHFGPILVRRLPRLPTDQTATLLQTGRIDPVAIMLPIVRELQKK